VAKRKTGLGVDAFFPEEESEDRAAPVAKTSAAKRSPRQRKNSIGRKDSGGSGKTVSERKEDKDQKIERRPAWIRIDHLEKLDILKHRERRRLRKEKKRVSRSTLIDEAIERYLAEKEKQFQIYKTT
jgi:hypothetical protein